MIRGRQEHHESDLPAGIRCRTEHRGAPPLPGLITLRDDDGGHKPQAAPEESILQTGHHG
jgi:hypothetical protein